MEDETALKQLPDIFDGLVDLRSEIVKSKIKRYMLKHHNIKWLNDHIEESLYDIILDIVCKIKTILLHDDD